MVFKLKNNNTEIRIPKKDQGKYQSIVAAYMEMYGGEMVKETRRHVYCIIYYDLLNKRD